MKLPRFFKNMARAEEKTLRAHEANYSRTTSSEMGDANHSTIPNTFSPRNLRVATGIITKALHTHCVK